MSEEDLLWPEIFQTDGKQQQQEQRTTFLREESWAVRGWHPVTAEAVSYFTFWI